MIAELVKFLGKSAVYFASGFLFLIVALKIVHGCSDSREMCSKHATALG